MKHKKVLILGAGVSGLSTGVLLLQNDYKVTIWAKELPPYTTSNQAAAVWYPFICGPKEKATTWARDTIQHFKKEVPFSLSGCKQTTVVEVFDKKAPEPWWKDSLDSYKTISKKKLPKNYIDGYEINGIVMDTDQYMEYLVETFKKLGGKIIKKEISDIKEAFNQYKLIVNCTGLGSRRLFGDSSVYPTRGQIVKIKPNGFDYSLFEQEGPNSLAYIIPRLKDIVLGGTAQDHNWSLDVDDNDT